MNRLAVTARAIQETLRRRVVTSDRLGPVRRVGGSDVAYDRAGRELCAAIAVFAYPALDLVDCAALVRPVRFPYRPGFLGFREAPAIVEAFKKLAARPDLLLVEGHGAAHPSRFGAACHVGVMANVPTVGVAKSRLVGENGAVPELRGARAPLVDGGRVVGAVLRTREGVKPVYVSPGHRVGLETAVEHTLRCCTRYRMPEPIRCAHDIARAGLQQAAASPESVFEKS